MPSDQPPFQSEPGPIREGDATEESSLSFVVATLERWLEELAPHLLSAATDVIDARIADAIAQVAELVDTDRSTVLELSDDGYGFRAIHAWSRHGVAPFPLIEVRELFPGLMARLMSGEVVAIEDIGELARSAPRDLNSLARFNQTSLLAFPLRVGDNTIGVYALGTTLRHHSWPELLVARLGAMATLIGAALARQRAEREVRALRDKLDELQRVANIGDWNSTLADGQMSGSDQLYRIFEIDRDKVLDTRTMTSRLYPPDRDRFERQITDWMAGRSSQPQDYRLAARRGPLRHVRCWGEVTSDPDGNPMRVLGVIQDITERKHDEQALRQLSQRLLRAHEDERTRIARELHDDVCQRLSALIIQGSLLANELQSAQAKRMAYLNDQLQELGIDVRRLSHGLHPSKLEHLGLVVALRAVCQDLAAIHQIDIACHGGLDSGSVPGDVALSLYRVTQEALHNVVKHSGATHATVVLGRDATDVVLTITDDGVGFEAADLLEMQSQGTSLGVLAMSERMGLVGGELDIQSSLGRGTQIHARVPLPSQADERTGERPLVDDGCHTAPLGETWRWNS